MIIKKHFCYLLFVIFVGKLDKEEIDNFVSYYKTFMLNYI
jgi:hypothetical protein